MAFDVVIMAGGPLPEALKSRVDGEFKGLIKFGKRTMLEMAVEMVRGLNEVGKIVCVGPVEIIRPLVEGKVDALVQSGDRMIETLRAGLDALPDSQELLISTCDIPLVTSEMVEAFIAECRRTNADVYYPIVERRLNEEKYPGMKRTYMKVREGVFTGGNVFLTRPDALRRNWGMIEQAMALRKSPMRLVGLLGFTFILKFIFKRLSIPELENKLGSLVGCRVKAVAAAHPEIGIDVDKESDYLLVKKALGG